MKVKHSKKKSRQVVVVALSVCWLLLIGYTGFYLYVNFIQTKDISSSSGHTVASYEVDETEVTQEKKDDYQVPNPSFPRYLSIPSLKISNARVVQIGTIKDTGQLDSPKSIYDAGWYTKSGLPGAGKGAVLIDGHNGGPTKGGIFENLGSLSKGSEIIIERGDGQRITYQVVDNREMSVEDINNESNPLGMKTMLNSMDPKKEGLNMITCVGDWDYAKNTFNKRVMLRAVRKM
ncbi:MAG: class F sortase [Candidatus Nanogingivalaceae bacterium]|nr:MAG: class F sortase [Candidatus Nanogingivalaceae bacterium]QWB91373.1 MAG: class F sortase [Candidatus Nanogingivalaceae bacterium]